MKKKIILISVLVAGILMAAVFYLTLPWVAIYLYGKFKTEEPEKPQITQESFPFTLVYEWNGKEIVIEDTMICKYTGSDWYMKDNKQSRTWSMELKSGGDSIVLWEGENDQKEKQKIIAGVEPEYYMDDVNDDEEYGQPDREDDLFPGMTDGEYRNSYLLLQTVDSEGGVDEEALGKEELLSKYGIKIVSWKCRQPIKNNFPKSCNFYTIKFSDNRGDLNQGEFKLLCPSIEFEGQSSRLEEKINETLYNASASWISKAFVKANKTICQPMVFCHSSGILSVGQFYEMGNYSTNNYITVDLMTGEQIFLDDIITDLKELARVLHEGEIMTASRNAFTLDQDEADAAVRESLREKDPSEIEEMLRQCSLEQKQFPLVTAEQESELPYVHERPNFYLQGGELVIEEGEWHNKIILKYKDIEYLLGDKYKEYLM